MNTSISHYLKKLWYPNASLSPINESTNNAVFSYGEQIIKVSDNGNNLKTEYEILSQLANKGKFPLAEQYGTIEGHFILVLQRLSWENLSHCWSSLSSSKRNQLFKDLVKAMKVIHSLPATPPNFVDYLVQQGTSYYYQNQDNPFLSSKQLEKIYLAFTKGISSFHQLQETVIHNDFRYKNILVEQGNLSGVIDFETAVQGPLCIEFFQLLFTHYYAKQEDDADEQDFMEQFLQVLPTLYPELCQYTDEQFRCFCLFRYLGKLVKFREPWYRHTEVEQFAKEFL